MNVTHPVTGSTPVRRTPAHGPVPTNAVRRREFSTMVTGVESSPRRPVQANPVVDSSGPSSYFDPFAVSYVSSVINPGGFHPTSAFCLTQDVLAMTDPAFRADAQFTAEAYIERRERKIRENQTPGCCTVL